MSEILNLLFVLLLSNVMYLAIFLFSFIIESVTGLRLMFDQLKWAKSSNKAEKLAYGNSGIYFVILFCCFIYFGLKGLVTINLYTSIAWIVITIPLMIQFRKFYNKFQKIDPNKSDDDYS